MTQKHHTHDKKASCSWWKSIMPMTKKHHAHDEKESYPWRKSIMLKAPKSELEPNWKSGSVLKNFNPKFLVWISVRISFFNDPIRSDLRTEWNRYIKNFFEKKKLTFFSFTAPCFGLLLNEISIFILFYFYLFFKNL